MSPTRKEPQLSKVQNKAVTALATLVGTGVTLADAPLSERLLASWRRLDGLSKLKRTLPAHLKSRFDEIHDHSLTYRYTREPRLPQLASKTPAELSRLSRETLAFCVDVLKLRPAE